MCGHMFVHIHAINTCVYVLLCVPCVHVLSTYMHVWQLNSDGGQENVSQAERVKGAILDVLDMTTLFSKSCHVEGGVLILKKRHVNCPRTLWSLMITLYSRPSSPPESGDKISGSPTHPGSPCSAHRISKDGVRYPDRSHRVPGQVHKSTLSRSWCFSLRALLATLKANSKTQTWNVSLLERPVRKWNRKLFRRKLKRLLTSPCAMRNTERLVNCTGSDTTMKHDSN